MKNIIIFLSVVKGLLFPYSFYSLIYSLFIFIHISYIDKYILFKGLIGSNISIFGFKTPLDPQNIFKVSVFERAEIGHKTLVIFIRS